MPGGRPRKWETVEALQRDIDKYWEYCKENDKPETIAGLAYYTNVDRHTIYNYDKRDEFFHTIKRARDRILMGGEERAAAGIGGAGNIFLMKNYGYKDKQEVESTIKSNDFIEALGRFTDKI